MIIEINDKNYIYQNLPIEVWQNFKNADSFGSYYVRNIKGKYQLSIYKQ